MTVGGVTLMQAILPANMTPQPGFNPTPKALTITSRNIRMRSVINRTGHKDKAKTLNLTANFRPMVADLKREDKNASQKLYHKKKEVNRSKSPPKNLKANSRKLEKQ